MRFRAAVIPMALAVLLGCSAGAAIGGGRAAKTPEQVVRAWSKALNANDNEAAGNLFAASAQVFQGNFAAELRTHRLAVLFNESLPCAGRIVFLRRAGTRVLATFVLGERPQH